MEERREGMSSRLPAAFSIMPLGSEFSLCISL